MPKSHLLVGNWKMSLGLSGSIKLAREVLNLAQGEQTNEFWVAPSFPSLAPVAEILTGSRVKLGAQNAHWELSGAFTGETSVSTLKEIGCSFVIIGHSERRHILHEDLAMVEKRFQTAATSGLTTILCIGETAEQRRNGETEKVLSSQIQVCVRIKDDIEPDSVIIAYEPVWAIGTGIAATLDQIEAAHKFIKSILPYRILYGGSVSPDNARSILGLPSVSGGLIGGASVDCQKLTALAQSLSHVS